jgi:biopolymer transport protein TolR
MAMSVGRSARNDTRRLYKPLAEINVTPFVDVMLVLLVIFMVTAPLLTVGVPVDLPRTNAAAINKPEEPLVVTVNAAGETYLMETKMELAEMVARLKAIQQEKPEQRIYIRGDKAIAYGRVMEVLGALNSAGIQKVALIAEAAEGSRPTPGRR